MITSLIAVGFIAIVLLIMHDAIAPKETKRTIIRCAQCGNEHEDTLPKKCNICGGRSFIIITRKEHEM